MGPAIAEALPLALAIAASAFPVIPALLLLSSPRPRATSTAYLAAFAGGILLVTLVATALSSVIEAREGNPTWAYWLKLAIGVALVIVGLRQWVARNEPQDPPGWMQSLSDADVGMAVKIGLLLALANPKVIVLAAGAGLGIGAAELPAKEVAIALVVFTVVAASAVAVPVVLYLVAGDRVAAPLGRAADWLVANNAAVVAAVIGVVGAVLVVQGIGGVR